MKICILSMQKVNNMGSLLQAYALKKTLEELGHSVSFIDIESNSDDNFLVQGCTDSFDKEGEASGTFFSKLKKLDRYAINRICIKRRANRQDELFERFRNMLGVDIESNEDKFDYCVIGSDEVFNCLTKAPWGFTSQLFGNVRQAEKVITYAACCGATVLENVPESALERIREAFARVSAFSVRDANTFNFVSGLSDKTVFEHFDPVVVGDFSEELSRIELPVGIPQRYCIVYSYYNRFCDKRDIKQIREFCCKHGMTPIAVGAPQMWIKNYPVVSPFEALKLFQNAAFVITDTFHGTIFSAKYSERFAVMLRASNNNKLGDLVKKLGVEKHLISSVCELENVFLMLHDIERIAELSKVQQQESIRYLKDHLI